MIWIPVSVFLIKQDCWCYTCLIPRTVSNPSLAVVNRKQKKKKKKSRRGRASSCILFCKPPRPATAPAWFDAAATHCAIEPLVTPCHTPFLDPFATQSSSCKDTPFSQKLSGLPNCCSVSHRRCLPTACRDAACPLPRVVVRSASIGWAAFHEVWYLRNLFIVRIRSS